MLRVKELILASLLIYGITAEIPEKAQGENQIGQQGKYCPNKDKETVKQRHKNTSVTCEIELDSYYTMDIRSKVSQIEIYIQETSNKPVGLANLSCTVPRSEAILSQGLKKKKLTYKIRNIDQQGIFMQCLVKGENMTIQVKMSANTQEFKDNNTQITTFPKPED